MDGEQYREYGYTADHSIPPLPQRVLDRVILNNIDPDEVFIPEENEEDLCYEICKSATCREFCRDCGDFVSRILKFLEVCSIIVTAYFLIRAYIYLNQADSKDTTPTLNLPTSGSWFM